MQPRGDSARLVHAPPSLRLVHLQSRAPLSSHAPLPGAVLHPAHLGDMKEQRAPPQAVALGHHQLFARQCTAGTAHPQRAQQAHHPANALQPLLPGSLPLPGCPLARHHARHHHAQPSGRSVAPSRRRGAEDDPPGLILCSAAGWWDSWAPVGNGGATDWRFKRAAQYTCTACCARGQFK